jgi:cytidylate kinase-like protein
METTIDKSRSFIASQFAGTTEMPASNRSGQIGPSVTISHQTGAGAHEVAERLAEILKQAEPTAARKWMVLDRQLVELALKEHHLPAQLAKKMPEDKRSYVDDILDDLFGLRPPSWILVPQVVETMQRLAEAGHVILIGRGATIVTARLPNVFHVRLVASLATRTSRIQASHGLSAAEAVKFVDKEDRGRKRYVQANFHVRLDDALLYHLVVNTDQVPFGDAAALIAEGAQRFFRRG